MSFTRRLGLYAVAGAMLSMTFQPASAQEIADEHLKAARAAIGSIRATAQFDDILPTAALVLQRELIQKNPDLEELITKTVNEQAFALAPRRGDLEREAALAYARSFSQEELQTIANFYNSEAGKKLLQLGPAVSQEVMRAADIWQNGIARDLALQVANVLETETRGQITGPDAAEAAQ